MKGETSGNRLKVERMLVDCDDDTLLVLVTRLGDGNVCHTGERTCFFELELDRSMKRVMRRTMIMQTLKLGIPKGSLQDATIQLFARAGFNIYASARSYFPAIDDPEIDCMLIRAQEMARYVADGVLDAGLTGQDWIAEHAAANGGDAAASRRSPISSTRSRASARSAGCSRCRKTRATRPPRDLEGATVATELVRATQAYFARHGVNGQRRVLVGRHRGQAAAARRRHRRGHRDRIVAAREPAPHHRHRPRVEHAAHRQSRRARGRVEAQRSSRTSRCC